MTFRHVPNDKMTPAQRMQIIQVFLLKVIVTINQIVGMKMKTTNQMYLSSK